jgi:hypothetical protein
MIIISLGNVGSGKSLNHVREMSKNPNLHYYSNIKSRLKNQHHINAKNIIRQDLVKTVKKRDGSKEDVHKLSLNIDFWKKARKPASVVLDECHQLLNPRKSMSKINILMGDWIAMLRRVLGETSTGRGDLILITHLPKRVDVICREMAHQVRYHVCYYILTCLECGFSLQEHSDMPEQRNTCLGCGSVKLKRHSHKIEIKHFDGMESYENYRIYGFKTFYRHYFVTDAPDYFGLYDSLQWDDLLSAYIS